MQRIKDNVWLILIVLGAFIGIVIAHVFQKSDRSAVDGYLSKVRYAKDLVDKKAEVDRATVTKGADVVVEGLKEEYAQTIGRMNQADRQRVEELKHDPRALVHHLLGATYRMGRN